MCLMLYLATAREQPTFASKDLNIEPVEAPNTVSRLFALPSVRVVGAHTGCSCGFPSIIAEQPFEYYDGMFLEGDNRLSEVESLQALLNIVKDHVAAAGSAELYAVWEGEESQAPKGVITVAVDQLDAERFFFVERFLYRVVPSLTSPR